MTTPPPSAAANVPAAPPRVFLIDAHAQLYRGYHAVTGLRSSRGFPTNALYGFVSIFQRVLKSYQPQYMAVVFDPKTPVFREKDFPDYKAHRPPMPDDLKLQVAKLHELLEAMELPAFVVDGFEADDVMATLARAGQARGNETWLVSSDKDLFQLISPGIRMLRYHLDKEDIVDEAYVQAKLGVAPERVTDYQGLVGDSTDGIPGIPGVGPKTALELLARFGTVEDLIARAPEIEKPRWRALVTEHAGKARISKHLATLRTDVPLDYNLDRMKWQLRLTPRLVEILRELEFHSILRDWAKQTGHELTSGSGTASAATSYAAAAPTAGSPGPGLGSNANPLPSRAAVSPAPSPTAQADLFGAIENSGAAPPTPVTDPDAPIYKTLKDRTVDYGVVRSAEELRALAADLRAAGRFGLDTETTGLNPFTTHLVGISVSARPNHGRYIPIAHLPEVAGGPQIALADAQAILGPLFADPSIGKLLQNAKFDYKVLKLAGLPVAGIVADPMIASFLLDPDRRGHGLKQMSKDRLGIQMTEFAEVMGLPPSEDHTIAKIPVDSAAPYACQDADITLQLADYFAPLLEEAGLTSLFRDVEVPLESVLAEMELAGVRIDAEYFSRLAAESRAKLADLEKRAHEAAGTPFNLGSPKQVATILFEHLKLPTQRKGKTGYSTDVEVLEELQRTTGHPILPLLLEWRILEKLLSTYLEALPKLIQRETGKLHTDFNQITAATGRLSSNAPNLQNIPIRTPAGRQVREGFIPSDADHVFLSADYSQIELRLLAHLSGDPALIDAFKHDADIHRLTAAKVFRVAPQAVTPDQRAQAKTVNFGVVYGISAHGLAQQLNIGRAEAQKFIDEYFAGYPAVRGWMDTLLEDARRTGEVRTMLGRRRYVRELLNSNQTVRRNAERVAINTPVQGSSADMIKIAMIRIHERMRREGFKARMILQVHDELVFDVPKSEADALGKLVSEEMEAALPLNVPVKAEAGTGSNWAEC